MLGSVYSQCLGDMNEDGIKDILDIVNLVNDILDGDDVCEETPPDDEECNCPAPDFESGTEFCEFTTNESCIGDPCVLKSTPCTTFRS